MITPHKSQEVAKISKETAAVKSSTEATTGLLPTLGAKSAAEGLAATRPARARYGDLGPALLYMAPALVIFAAFTFIPFIRSVWLSFFVTDQAGNPSYFNDIKYYTRILNLDGSGREEYLQSIVTTIKFAIMVVPTGIVVAVGLALLATAKLRGIAIFRTIFTSTVAISVASASVIWALLYNPSIGMSNWVLDLLNLKTQGILLDPATALPAVAFMTIWTSLGFDFIIALAGLQAIPQDLYDSSSIDGATGWQQFRSITLPLLTPTLLFLVIISTIGAFQAFTQFNVLIANEGPDGSTNVMVYQLFSSFFKDNRYGFASAIAVVLFVVLATLSIIQFKFLDRRVHYQ
ncbi:MAG: sugar ABC transporter permease [Chloroflexi bacterium]|nr:sugar ABC transporter permease [Chloroflexota bacterium]